MRAAVALAALSLAVAPAPGGAPAPAKLAFVDVAREAGLASFRLQAGSREKRHIPEAMSGGVAWLDFDNDGDWDLFFCQGGAGVPPKVGAKAAPGSAPALFRNELRESGRATFTDVTAAAGLARVLDGAWGMGVTVADFDADGDPDVYLTALGSNRLLRNDTPKAGKPRFVEVGHAAGVDLASWSTGAAFADADGDGDLDLYVATYVDFDPAFVPKNETFTHWRGIDVFPGPVGLPGASDHYFRSLLKETGKATFVDASKEAALSDAAKDYGFGVVFLDFDSDGDQDLFVANDSTPNRLHRNDGKGRFEDVGFLAGVAFSEDGKAQAGMGVAAGDYDVDGHLDLAVTNFSYDYDTLYRNTGRGFFEDVSHVAGIGQATYYPLAFGITFCDADLDGDEDLFIANGHIYPQVDRAEFRTSYAQANLLFQNVPGSGGRTFVDRSADAGAGLAVKKVSRGCAAADFDGDGDLDLVVNELDDTPTLLRNDTSAAGHWLAVRCAGRGPNTAGIGARVRVTAGGRTQVREVRTSASYLAVEPPVAHFGLGSATTADVEVRFPSGRTVTVRGVSGAVVVTEP